MQVIPKKFQQISWRNLVSWIYRVSLSLYPKSYRDRFGTEMNDVFNHALAEHSSQSRLKALSFLGRELRDAPVSILRQHFAANSFWLRPYPINIIAFIFSFILVGLLDYWNTAQTFVGLQGFLINLLSLALAGAISGLAIGILADPQHKNLFAFCGSIGFLLANIYVPQILSRIFPDAFAASGQGMEILLPFLFPIVEGFVFGLFIGLASGRWHNLLQFSGWGSLALFMGFFVNRLSAALLQSFLFHSATQNIAQMGIIGFFMPYLLEGAIMGALFGRIKITKTSLSAKQSSLG